MRENTEFKIVLALYTLAWWALGVFNTYLLVSNVTRWKKGEELELTINMLENIFNFVSPGLALLWLGALAAISYGIAISKTLILWRARNAI